MEEELEEEEEEEEEDKGREKIRCLDQGHTY